MAEMSSSNQLAVQMPSTLESIKISMNTMVSSMAAAQTAINTGFNTTQAVAMRQAVSNVSVELTRYREGLERINQTPVKAPEPPTWNSVASEPVFMNSGAGRFEQEYQAAATAAQQLYKNQLGISAQARRMRVVPPGMLNDVAATSVRVQSLSHRIEKLNSIPVNLRTDKVNNELETLRGKLSQAATVQGQLSSAMSRMDISASNAAYQELNSIMDSAERDIRNNFVAQEQFNQSVKGGQSAAGDLGSSIKRYAGMLINAASAGKLISLADQVTQTTARLDQMNYGLDTAEQLQQKIFQAAQRSRGAYQTTADAVTKMGLQARGAFSSNDELIAFTEQLNKSFAIAGTSAQGVDSVMSQITESMASGKLQGEGLNTVLDNAKPIVQNIADYMGIPIEQVKQMAADGAISAEVIKNAMFAASDETNEKFGQMPMTFGQVTDHIRNQALMAFQPALQQISAMTQTDGFNALSANVANGIQLLAGGAVQALDMMGQAVLWAQDNWAWLEPVILGVTSAILAYKGAVLVSTAVQAISNGLKTLGAIASVAHGAAVTSEMAATTGMTTSQIGFNAALLACPLTWIVVAIIAAVAAIAIWVNHIGGLKVAWLTCVDSILTRVGLLKLNLTMAWNGIQNGIDGMIYGFELFKVNVLNSIGNLKVMGLRLLQDFINSAIDNVNTLIEAVNSVAGTSIDTIAHVEFVGNAAVEEEANQKQRAADLAALKEQNAIDKQARKQQMAEQYQAFQDEQQKRQDDIAAAKLEAESKKNAAKAAEENTYVPGTENGYTPAAASGEEVISNTGDTAANTAAMADSMNIMDEDLKYMRDAAEQEIINRFTLADLKVNVSNNNKLTKKADFEDMGSFLSTFTGEFLAAAAEGGHI